MTQYRYPRREFMSLFSDYMGGALTSRQRAFLQSNPGYASMLSGRNSTPPVRPVASGGIQSDPERSKPFSSPQASRPFGQPAGKGGGGSGGGLFIGRAFDATRFRPERIDDAKSAVMSSVGAAGGHYTNRDFNRDLRKTLEATYPGLDIDAWQADNERAARSRGTYRGLSLPQFYAQQQQRDREEQQSMIRAANASHQMELARAARDGEIGRRGGNYNLMPPPPGPGAIGTEATAVINGQAVSVMWNGRGWERMDAGGRRSRAAR